MLHSPLETNQYCMKGGEFGQRKEHSLKRCLPSITTAASTRNKAPRSTSCTPAPKVFILFIYDHPTPHSTTLVDGFNKNTPRTQPLGFYHWNHPSASIAQDRPASSKVDWIISSLNPTWYRGTYVTITFQSSQVQNFVLINRKHAFLKKRCASTSSVEDQFCDGFVQENNSKIGRLVVAPFKITFESFESFPNPALVTEENRL